MGLFKKNTKVEEPEPKYYMSATNMQMLNYKVYYMSKLEKMLYFLLAFIIGAAVGYLFYGGIGKDEFGNPTMLTHILNIMVSTIVGGIAGKLFLPVRVSQIITKRKRTLNLQFRDMLEALSTSLSAGKNVTDSFKSVYGDLKIQYAEDAFILNEIACILAGINNNIAVEDMLSDFGTRSGIDDISSFANVFSVCYKKGGNIKETIAKTHEILSDKIEISEDIETTVTSSKSEQNMMIFMPVILIGMMKTMSPDFADNFVTPVGIIATTIGVVLFVIAYFVGRSILNIKL